MGTNDVPIWLMVVAFVAVAAGVHAWLQMLHSASQRFHRSFNAQMRHRLNQMFLFVDPNRLFVLNLIAILLIGALAWLLSESLVVTVFVLLVAGWLPAIVLRRLEQNRQRQLERQLPDTFMQLAATLRSGLSLPMALDHVAQRVPAPLGDELQLLARERRLGLGLEESLGRLLDRIPLESVHLFVCLLTVSQRSGGGLAQSLTVLASGCRRRLLIRSKLWALTAQGRLQAHVMSAVPVLVAGALFLLEPDAMRQLWSTPLGHVVLVTIALMLAAGIWLVQRISKGFE